MAAKRTNAPSGAKRALMLLGKGFEDLEFFYPYYRLKEAGMEVDVAGTEKSEIEGKHGYSFGPNLTFAEAARKKYDLLVIPGGKGPETVRLDAKAVEIARTMMHEGKPVAAICHGAQVLISADVLRGRKATCWAGVRDDVKQAGAEYQDREVVVDGNLITSRSPDDLPAFCREILRKLQAF